MPRFALAVSLICALSACAPAMPPVPQDAGSPVPVPAYDSALVPGVGLERSAAGFIATSMSEPAFAQVHFRRTAICASIGKKPGFLKILNAKGTRPFKGELPCS